ncbi:MAG TPA: hypothetical protein VJN94_08575 [Candidatus Binataceae bacterium]|nr:hypothetical protein [Candidatus Binataceae bacterium]
MGSVSKFERPRPLIRLARKIPPEREPGEALRSLYILVGAFCATAVAMCVVVVAMVSNNWTDIIVMSAFVIVFALLKIGLANALMYVMVRYDTDRERTPVSAGAPDGRPTSFRRVPEPKLPRRRTARNGPLGTVPAHPSSPAG